MYGDPESYDLRHALAAGLGIAPGEVVVGEGIDGLLGYARAAFRRAGATALLPRTGPIRPSTTMWPGFGGELIKVPYVDDREDPESLLAAARGAWGEDDLLSPIRTIRWALGTVPGRCRR
jgi:histidinol-phosphate aminotransferase